MNAIGLGVGFRKFGMAAGLAILLAIAGHAHAADASPYARTGTIDTISVKNGYIVIDERQYPIAADLRVHSGGAVLSAAALRRGQTVGYNKPTGGSLSQRAPLRDVWLLSR